MTNRETHQDGRSDDTEEAMKKSFIYWQCSLRQQTVREGDGRPVPGMCPEVTIGKDEQLGKIIVHILKNKPDKHTAQFQHIVKKTHDPLERWESAINALSSTYYQHPDSFSPRMTALFGTDSHICYRLLDASQCILKFGQLNRRFKMPCAVYDLSEYHPEYQGTYWHNSMFNPSIPGDAKILCFEPDWLLVKD